jgi:hypothetical protein
MIRREEATTTFESFETPKKVFDAIFYQSCIAKGIQFDIFSLCYATNIVISVRVFLAEQAFPQIQHTARDPPRIFHATISDITGLRFTAYRGCCTPIPNITGLRLTVYRGCCAPIS